MIRSASRLLYGVLGCSALGCDALAEDDCAGFEDEQAVGVTFTIVNAGSLPLKLGNTNNCFSLPLFSLALDGERLPANSDACNSCASRIALGFGGCGSCEQASVVVVHPGARHDLKWDGAMVVERPLPSRCGGADDVVITCDQKVAAPSGEYEVSVTAFTEHQCFDGTACICGAEGTSCVLPNSVVAGAGVVLSTTFEHCPGVGGCQPAAVELVFR